MWYPVAIGPGHPLIQPRIEFVNARCGELDDLRELHFDLTSGIPGELPCWQNATESPVRQHPYLYGI
jgi:hypothetical protein